jgi:hypothetical protein
MSDTNPPTPAMGDRALGRIGFNFLHAGTTHWATGEFESFVRKGETEDDAIARAEENALTIAFDIRDAFVDRRNRERASQKETKQ